jgi:hypothetical protein
MGPRDKPTGPVSRQLTGYHFTDPVHPPPGASTTSSTVDGSKVAHSLRGQLGVRSQRLVYRRAHGVTFHLGRRRARFLINFALEPLMHKLTQHQYTIEDLIHYRTSVIPLRGPTIRIQKPWPHWSPPPAHSRTPPPPWSSASMRRIQITFYEL